MASIQTYDWIVSGITHIFLHVQRNNHAVEAETNGGRAMKMTDQMERDFFQAEMTSGRINQRSENAALIVATIVIGALLFASILMISLGR